jgi:hypothetical protein
MAAPNISLSATPPKSTEKSATETTRFDAYAKPDGTSYYALSLMPQVTLPAAESSDVVILFDTSARQVGPYREKGLEMLRGLLATLGNNDRVKLMAVDLNAVPLTTTFVSPRGPEIEAALQQLQQRVPLGATDLEATLKGIAGSFNAAPAKQTNALSHAAVYIGDGQSNANLIGEDVNKVMDQLVKNRVSFNCFVVGPGDNSALLAALANQSGGVLLLDSDQVAGREVGAHFAQAIHEPIIWPTDRKLPAFLTDVYPTNTPPLRTDRDTVLLGTGAADGTFAVEIKGDAFGQPVDMKWDVKASKPSDDNAYLAPWVEFAKNDGGRRLPTLGSEGLWAARRVSDMNAHTFAQLGRQAAAEGNVKQAQQFVDEALKRDPMNSNALVLKQSMQSGVLHASAMSQTEDAAPTVAQTAVTDKPQPNDAAPVTDNSKDSDLLNSVEQSQRVIQQKVMTETTVALNRARDQMTNDPGAILEDLKLLMDRVLRVPELSSDQRADLRSRLSALMEQASQRRFEKEAADVQRAQNMAEARDRKRILDTLMVKEERLKGLIDRFNALIEQGYTNADQVTNEPLRASRRDAADEFRRAAANPYGRAPVAATTAPAFSEFTQYSVENAAVRDAAERSFMDTLHLVDISHIPFPDSPPIVYPDAAFWRKISRDENNHPGGRITKYSSMDLLSSKPSELAIIKALDDKTNLDFQGTPLSDAMEFIADKHHIPIQFDPAALKDAGLDPTTMQVTMTFKDVSLKSALKLMLAQFNLSYLIKDEVLQITTKEKADTTLTTKVYYVGDLVVPIQSQGINPFQLGGGLGGGGGGLGGGLGGAGGGAGGGLGGGLGGGMGGGAGGAFSLPPESTTAILPQPDTGGALDVSDSPNAPSQKPQQADSRVSTSVRPVSNTAPTVTNAAAPATTDKIAVNAGSDPNKSWNEYFANLKQPDEQHVVEITRKRNAAIADTAKELMNDRKFDQVTALINAALRNGYAQPWMYEALALSLQACDQPKEEIERALMSAADFARSPTDLVNVAIYMARIGLDARALKLLRQVSVLEPFRHEPYLHGLTIAQRLNDVDGIRWACLGVLSQAWPNDKKEIVQTAQYAADALLDKLRSAGQAKQAAEFRKQLDDAQIRDCMVKVSWTGNADIDLAIEEPTGAICKFTNPRTTGGGVMQGDTYAKSKSLGSDGSSEYSQSYVLPQGFSGQYKVLVRRLWGQVATGKVTVDVYTHFGTTKVLHIHRQIPVSERDALVLFDLNDGRRKEPLDQAQLALAVDNQEMLSRAILSEQLSTLDSESSSAADLPNGGAGNKPVTPFNFPFFRAGAVGYQPVITVLPEGTNLFATAVVSADRRYVRITPFPFFSTIGPVDTFNFVSGQTGGGTTTTGGTTTSGTTSGGTTTSGTGGGTTLGGGGF